MWVSWFFLEARLFFLAVADAGKVHQPKSDNQPYPPAFPAEATHAPFVSSLLGFVAKEVHNDRQPSLKNA